MNQDSNSRGSDKRMLVRNTTSFVDTKHSALKLVDLYKSAGISLNKNCDLGRLITEAVEVADSWLAGKVFTTADNSAIARGQYLDRIVTAALPLASVSDCEGHLRALKKGSLDPSTRTRSLAKDKFWELELWVILNKRGVPAVLNEPDIIATIPRGEISIACKRIYSPTNARKQMSNGVKQIAKYGRTGILAVNIDDLLPAHALVEACKIEDAALYLDGCNSDFATTNHKQISGYIAAGRAAAIWIAICCPVRIPPGIGTVSECRQNLFWVHPHLDEAKAGDMSELQRILYGTH